MLELTKRQHQAVEKNGDEPVRILDPENNAEYVLVKAEVYERIKSFLADDWSVAAYASGMEVFGRDGWNDPRMDVYDSVQRP